MPGRRSWRAAAKKAAAALGSTPREPLEDEDMPDADGQVGGQAGDEAEDEAKDGGDDDAIQGDGDGDDGDGGAKGAAESGDGEEAEDEDDDDEADEEGEGEEEEDGEEGEEDDEEAEGEIAADKEPTPPPQPMVRRKRLGRPPKNKPPDWDPMVMVPEDTPRRRGRGGWRGRGGRKGGPPAPKAEQVIDGEGTVAEIAGDECVLAEDSEGETKVDKMGKLSGGREYRCRTFTILGRGERLYMLSTEPARCVGFRDSYLFFTKHKKLHKIIVGDEEKRDMIEREIIPHSYKGRSIGIVTARSVFREFGARIIVGGRRITDDYNVAQARADGAVEGQLADPDDRYVPGQAYNKNQYVAWHGASAVYHTNMPSVPVPAGKAEYRKRKVNVNDTNWMLEHAREASIFNSSINAIRKLNNMGVYDIHTNAMHFPANMQPTAARIEHVSPDDEDQSSCLPSVSASASASAPASAPSLFNTMAPLPAKLTRNFLIMDMYLESPPPGTSGPALDRTDPAHLTASFSGLAAVPDDVKDLLPDQCRKAFDHALEQDKQWKSRWGLEKDMVPRHHPVIDKALMPYVQT